VWTNEAGIARNHGLCVNYGRVEAIHKVDIRIREGEIVTVIGPNGAGKTTLLSALMGLLPARGEVKYQDHSVLGTLSVDALVAKGLVLVPEKRELFGSMSVADNLLLGAFARHRRGDRDHAKTMDEVYRHLSRAWPSAASRKPARSPAASARCWPWAAP
jgi:branched-chain amino acid transport system ATP-binding protein